MPKSIRENAADIRNFMRKENNFISVLLILILIFSIYSHIITANMLINIKKKVDHRYFNTTTSLEQIHHVRIDTYDGQLK